MSRLGAVPTRYVLPFAAVLATLGCGCGCGGAQSQPSAAEGQSVFESECSGCHTLAHPRSPSPVGGDLAGYRMSVAEVASFAKIMPTPRALSPREIDAVAAYISSVQRRTPQR